MLYFPLKLILLSMGKKDNEKENDFHCFTHIFLFIYVYLSM